MPRLSTRRLTPSLIRTAPIGDHPDAEVRGLTLHVTATSRRFSLRYRPGPGLPQKRIAIGDATVLTLEEARVLARGHLAARDKGEDPAVAKAEHRALLTVAEATEKWLTSINRSASTMYAYRHRSKDWIKVWGTRKVTDITRADVKEFYRGLPFAAASTRRTAVAILKALFAWMLDEEIIQANPCTGVRTDPGDPHERFLSDDERDRFEGLLHDLETSGEVHQGIVDALRLLLLTGCRKGEILGLTWSEVDLEGGALHLEETKTGRSHRPLSDEAVEVLKGIQARRSSLSPLVCPSVNGGEITTLDHHWVKVRGRIGLEDVRIHDLRHSLASDGAAAGLSLLEIGAQLGHAATSSTARYAHLCQKVAREGANRISDRRKARSSSSNVLPLPKKKPA